MSKSLQKWFADLTTTVPKPANLFTWMRIEAGQLPEFPLEILELPVGHTKSLILPARQEHPVLIIDADYVHVPHFEISHQHEEAQTAIDRTIEEVNDHAWRLLQSALTFQPNRIKGSTEQEIRNLMRLRFAKILKKDEKNIQVKLCVQGDDVIGVCKDDDFVIITDHSDGMQCFHTPHLKPVCFIDMGFVILDYTHVLGGKLCKQSSPPSD